MIQLVTPQGLSFYQGLPQFIKKRNKEQENEYSNLVEEVTPKILSLVQHVVFPDTQRVNKIN